MKKYDYTIIIEKEGQYNVFTDKGGWLSEFEETFGFPFDRC
ncbi:MAG: hypothetical protein ACRENW_04775 [Thermodesulfobacteriota bacterium]